MPASQAPSAYIIDAAKVQDYLLAVDHPVGGSKAAFFLKCGFAAERSDLLADSLFAHAVPDHLVASLSTPFGTKWIFEGDLQAPVGEIAEIRSIWIVRQDASFA